MPVADENAGAAATGQPRRAGWQSASPRVESVGSTPPTRSIGVPTTIAAMCVEYQRLPEMRDHQQLAGRRETLGWCGIPITG